MPKIYKWLFNLEDSPENPLTRDRIVEWMADTGYVEGLVGKRISPMDRLQLEDYIQEVWVQILEVPNKKLVEIYRKGKGVFTNYIKSIVLNNIKSKSSPLYNNIKRGRKEEVFLDQDGWNALINGNSAPTSITYPGVYRRHEDRAAGLRYNHKIEIEYENIEVNSENELFEETEREECADNDHKRDTIPYPSI